jgi:sialate O-acetylesterase
MFRHLVLSYVVLCSSCCGIVRSQENPEKMPREDVVDVPAIGQGLCVSNIFQTNMVLQRDKPVQVWGWAEPGEQVAVSFAGQRAEAKAAKDRLWTVTLDPMPAESAPRTMTVQGESQTLTLENILVGDVWLLGGQSNMEFELSKIDDGPLEIASANFPQIRLLTLPQGKGFDSVKSFERLHEWSSWSSRHFRKGDWDVCSPETVSEFSAIGYVFGRRLHMATRIPIGLIDASIGGTTVETWTPDAVLQKIEGRETQDKLREWADKIAEYDAQADLRQRIANYERQKRQRAEQGNPLPADSQPPDDLRPGPIADRNRPGYCYASVIRPLEELAIKGAVFHQGFNNCFDGSAGSRMYYQVFGEMITAWRSAFRDARAPFCIISLCTAGEPQTRETFLQAMNDIGPLIREAQYQTFCDFREAGDREIGFVSSFDLRKSWYHPQIKIPAGERAAKWALVTQYRLLHGDDHWLPPTINKVKCADGEIQLTTSTELRTKDDSDGKMLGFAIAAKDRRFYPADIQWRTDGVDDRNQPRYQRNVLVLSSPFVPEPVHYRYAWARNPMANLVNARQIPLATQRNDDWDPEETPIRVPTPPGMDSNSRTRYRNARIRRELELADTLRQIKQAEATIARLKQKFLADKEAWEKTKAAEAERIREATRE